MRLRIYDHLGKIVVDADGLLDQIEGTRRWFELASPNETLTVNSPEGTVVLQKQYVARIEVTES